MTAKRVFYIITGSLVLMTALGVAGLVLGNKLLVKSSGRLNSLKLETSVIDEQHNSLKQAKQDIEKYAELESIAKTVVPQEKDQARTVREIVRFAEESGVPITDITFPSSDLGSVKAKPTTPAPSTDSSSTPKAPAAPATPPVSQVKPVEGIKGVYQLEVTIQNDNDSPTRYQNLLTFLHKLEQNRRTSQVTNVGIQPDPKNRNLITYNMTINVYIKPAK